MHSFSETIASGHSLGACFIPQRSFTVALSWQCTQAMQKEFHLLPESEGELRWSLEHSNMACGFSVFLMVDKPGPWNDVQIHLPATSLERQHPQSSFMLSNDLNSFLPLTQPCQLNRCLFPLPPQTGCTSVRKDIWQFYIPWLGAQWWLIWC